MMPASPKECMTDRHRQPAAAEKGTLYVVATPLGNLRDITLRALDILGSVDLVAAEDTRNTARLLAQHGLAPRLMALHQHNERSATQTVVDHLQRGEAVALVSDAGTPALSDPGGLVVAAVRAAGFVVVPVPGPSALAAAYSVAGLAQTGFAFLGFLPAKSSARRKRLEAFAALDLPLICYEAPHRVLECVADLRASLGGERSLVIARELTKLFETIHVTTLAEAEKWLLADANRQRGEFVLIVAPPVTPPAAMALQADALLRELLTELPPSRAAALAARLSGEPRRSLYERALALAQGGGQDDAPAQD